MVKYWVWFGVGLYWLLSFGYDVVLLMVWIVCDWKFGMLFLMSWLCDGDGFLGIDGVFWFGCDSVVEWVLEVKEICVGGMMVVLFVLVGFGG